MHFLETRLLGAFLIELERHEDERGFFARTFCEREFAAHGLVSRYRQCNLSRNRLRGTLRSMHYQAAPHREAKLVRCVSGVIYDVIVDLRQGSPTRLQWTGVELSAEGGTALYVPPGFAYRADNWNVLPRHITDPNHHLPLDHGTDLGCVLASNEVTAR